jgi:hypothetical protein
MSRNKPSSQVTTIRSSLRQSDLKLTAKTSVIRSPDRYLLIDPKSPEARYD